MSATPLSWTLFLTSSVKTSSARCALEAIGYKPLVPVRGADFADETLRESWRRDKNMLVFQLMDTNRPDTRLEVFVTEPFDFTAEFQLDTTTRLRGVDVPVIRIETLLAMKREAGRPKDLGDISELEALSEHRRHE